MNCPLEQHKLGWCCPICGWLYKHKTDKPPHRNCPESKDNPRPVPQFTTGTILHDLLADKLGVGLKQGCGCKAWIDKMNTWGPEGSRENLVGIANALLAEAKRRHWKLDGHPLLSKAAQMGTEIPGGMIFARAWVRRIVNEAITRSEQMNLLKSVELTGHEYRKKPLVVQAVQWLNKKIVCPPGPDWFAEAEESGYIQLVGHDLHIKTLEGVMVADPGDWIIRGVEGDVYPCKDSIFRATYEKVE